jgi:hypothetical protein
VWNGGDGGLGEGRRLVIDWWDLAVRLVVVLAAFLALPLLVGQAEHKAMAHMQ